jgi:hypothetical protein
MPFNYDAIPRKLPLSGMNKRSNRRKNKLLYNRKIPHATNPSNIQSIMSNYLDVNKVLSVKEIMPPGIENEFSCALSFNKETVNTVLNYARQ